MGDYEILFGSDSINEGVYLELNLLPGGSQVNPVLFAFRSDIDGKVTFSALKKELPFELVEAFTERVREELLDRAVNE